MTHLTKQIYAVRDWKAASIVIFFNYAFNPFLLYLFGHLITLCGDADARCPSVFPGVGQRLHWGFEDPAASAGPKEETLARFREVRDQIDERVKGWTAELSATGEGTW